ncbi:hypothetical protein PR202_ga00702 [Eleusine coracana subsp. coracana]|uniref:anthranilate synthase n=1 Tax=Eleusine coracana subsp. coracana TaxID=191504 RepID=A0AAV5BH72_ELECO|nr:hypothetical protein PR202_ga00702 [Eleusine coracana subsp. coracana]
MMSLNAPLVAAAPFTSRTSSAAASTKLPLLSRVGKKGRAVMQRPASALRLCYIRSASDPFIVVDNGDDFTNNPRAMFISPGPGMPQDSGVSMKAIQELGPAIPIFGVCLGLQCIGEAFGGKIVSVPSDLANNDTRKIYFNKEPDEMGLFDNFYRRPFIVTQHDSRVIDKETFPHDTLEITAWTEDGLVMAARHKKYNHIQGVNFIPECVVMDEGKRIVFSFIKFVEEMEGMAAKETRATRKLANPWEDIDVEED